MILLLNKQDLLKTKVLEGRFKIETYFPEYSTYQLPIDSDCKWIVLQNVANYSHLILAYRAREPGETEEVRRAKGFNQGFVCSKYNQCVIMILTVKYRVAI